VGEEGGWRHQQVSLAPDNPDYEPITLSPRNASDFRIVGELLFVL
jgi:SOS-response transcriptional repressor LexA